MEKETVTLCKHSISKIFEVRSAKMVGYMMKRFETMSNKEDLKKEAKELIYEQLREIKDLILDGKAIFYSNYKDDAK